MSFIPSEELQKREGPTLAPLIDFLFLMLAVFASLAFSRMVIRDSEINLVKSVSDAPATSNLFDQKVITITISKAGNYTWVTEVRDYSLSSADKIAQELERQYLCGLLPADKLQTQILFKIDKEAEWEPIFQALLAIQEAGFKARPVYETSVSEIV